MTKFEEELKKVANAGIDINRKEKTYYERDILRLSEGWVSPEEHQTRVDELIETKEKNIELLRKNSTLKSQLQQQALPVVSEDVAKIIKKYNVYDLINYNLEDDECEILDEFVYKHIKTEYEKYEYIAQLVAVGYIVEKPQLFYLKNKLTGDCLAVCLARASSGLYVEVTEKWLTRKEQTSYKLYFTQQEIDSMQTGSYEQIEVEK